MSTNSPKVVDAVADPTKVPNGLGTFATLPALVAAWVAAVVAVIDAGSNFYQDNGVIGLIAAAVGGSAAFYASRSSQANKRVEAVIGTEAKIHAVFEQMVSEYTKAMAEEVAAIENEQDEDPDVPPELKDEVVTADPGDEAVDNAVPPR